MTDEMRIAELDAKLERLEQRLSKEDRDLVEKTIQCEAGLFRARLAILQFQFDALNGAAIRARDILGSYCDCESTIEAHNILDDAVSE